MPTLQHAAARCLAASDPDDELRLTFEAADAWIAGGLRDDLDDEAVVEVPGRPERAVGTSATLY